MQAKINEEKIYKLLKEKITGILLNGFFMIVIALLLKLLCSNTNLILKSISLYRICRILSVVFVVPGGILFILGILKIRRLHKMHKMPIICTAVVIVAKRGNMLCVEFEDKSLHNFVSVCSKEAKKGEKYIIFHKQGMIYDFS